MENNNDVKAFYETNYKEDARENRETLEFIRSKNIITRYLTGGVMEIADVGGGPGAYSFWLAGMGHQVHLLDLAQNHIEIAKQKSQITHITLSSYACADARNLPYDNESMEPSAYSHTPDEIISEMSVAGFEDIHPIAIEGIANALGENKLPVDEKAATQLLRCIELTESTPELLGVSRNIMAAGKKPF